MNEAVTQNIESSSENHRILPFTTRFLKVKLSPQKLKIFLIIANIFELGLAFLFFVSNLSSYPSGLFGDFPPTTKEELSRSLVTLIILGIIFIFSFLYIKYVKFFSDLYHTAKVSLYLFVIGRLLWAFFYNFRIPSLGIELISFLIFLILALVVFLLIPVTYSLFLIVLVIKNYQYLKTSQEKAKQDISCKNLSFFITMILLILSILGGIFLFQWTLKTIDFMVKQGKEKTEQYLQEVRKENKEKLEQNNQEIEETLANMQIVERMTTIDKSGWVVYNFSPSKYIVKHPADFPLEKSDTDRKYVRFRKIDTSSHIDHLIYLKYDEDYRKFSNSDEAIDYTLSKIKPELFRFLKKLNNKIEKSSSVRGWNLFFIEYGSIGAGSPKWPSQISIIIELPSREYLFWEGSAKFEGGLEIIKQIIETIEPANTEH